MQSLAKLLVIEDDAAIRLNLSVILEFVGEQCEVIESTQIDQINWSAVWGMAFQVRCVVKRFLNN
uniref:hypothetical protein n=1 Tax=Vibrio cholerae TaxID=666 RepID=UPI003F586116